MHASVSHPLSLSASRLKFSIRVAEPTGARPIAAIAARTSVT